MRREQGPRGLVSVVLLVLAVALSSACSARIGDLTVASTKNIPTDFQIVQPNVKGKDCSYLILMLIPIGSLNPTLDGAIDEALKSVPAADALVNAKAKVTTIWPLLWVQSCIHVEGDAISTR